MKKSTEQNIPDTFKQLHRIANGKVPPGGYVEEFANATERGRAKMRELAAAERRGIATFPPARLLNKGGHKP